MLDFEHPHLSTMGAAFLGAVEHHGLRKITFPVSSWTIFDEYSRPCARKWSIYYWEIVPSSSMLDLDRAHLSTMGAAFLGPVEHRGLRKVTFPVSFWLIFDEYGRPSARKCSIYYWKIALSFSILDLDRAHLSTMGAAFLGALQHDDLRNLAFLIWKLTNFAPPPASMLKFNEIPYWEMARPRPRPPSMLRPWPRGPRENDRPSGRCEHFWAVSQIVYRGKSQHWRGGRGREGYFPNKKIDEIRRFATEIGPKIAHFRPNRTLKQSILKSSCFHWSSRAQKSVSHSGHFEDG